MTVQSEGIISKTISLITANLADDFVDWVQRKLATHPTVQHIRAAFQKDRFHSDAKTLFDGAVREAFHDSGLDEQKFKEFIEDSRNRLIIYDLILSYESESEFKLDIFSVDPYFSTKIERQELGLVLRSIRLNIIEKKKETFSPETINVLSHLKRIESKLDDISSTIVLRIEDNLRPIETGVSRIESTILQKHSEIIDLVRNLAVGKPKSYVTELSQAKELIDEGKHAEAKAQLKVIQNLCDSSTDKETLFLINAYFAQIFLSSFENQKEAIPYIEKAIEFCEEPSKKLRNISVLCTLNGRLDAALESIDKALILSPSEPKNLTVKANVLLNRGSFDLLLKLVNENRNSGLDLFLGLAYLRREEFENAIKTAENIIEQEPNNVQALILLVDSIVFYSKHLIRLTLNPNNINTNLAHKAISTSSRLLEILSRTSIEYLDILVKRALLYSSQNLPRKASGDLQSAYTLSPENPTVLKNYAINCIELEEYSKAVELSEALVKVSPENEDAILLHAETLIQNGNISKSINLLETSQFKSPEADLKRKLLQIEAYNINFESSKSDAIIENISKIQSELFCPEIIKAKQAHFIGQPKLAIKILENSSDSRFEYQRNLMLAGLYYESNETVDKEKSLSLYELVSSIQILDNALFRRVYLKHQLGDFITALDLCSQIQSIHGCQREYSELEGVIYFNSGNFFPAGEIFKSLSQKYPAETRYGLSYVFCLFRLGKESEATDALRIVERKKDHSAKNLAALSTAFASTGNYEKSIELAFLALKKEFNDPNFHVHFFASFLRVQSKLENISAHIIDAFHDVRDNFSTRFPNNDLIQRIEYPSDKPEVLFELIKNRLELDKKSIANIEQMYVEKKLPISFLAKALNRSLLIAWSVARHDPNLKIWSNHGAPNELVSQLKALQDLKEVVMDPSTFLTVYSMNLLDHLLESVEILWLSQAFLDSIYAEIASEDFSLEKGHMTIFSENGVLYREEIPPDAIQKRIDYLTGIKTSIVANSKIKIFGDDLSNNRNETEEKLEKCFGKETSRTIIFSKNRHVKVYCDEVRLRELLRTDFGVASFSTRAFLELLKTKGKITDTQLQDYLVDLYFHNHNFISITHQTIIRAVEKANFFPSRECLRFIDYLKQKQEESALLNLTINFLTWLWLYGPTKEIRTTWTDILLNAATWRRDKKRMVEIILENVENIIPDLMRENRPKLVAVLRTWLLSKPLV